MIGTIIILNSAVEGWAPEKRSGVHRNAGCCAVSLEQKGIRAGAFVARLLLLRSRASLGLLEKEIRDVLCGPGGIMKSTLLASVLVSALCFFSVSPAVRGQGVGTSGEIRGTVTDPAGATVPRATIVAEDTEKGIRRTSLTDDNGQYEFSGLPPATYRITARISGFRTEILRDVVVTVGQTVILDIPLKISTGSEVIEVTTEPPVVETERTHQADTVSEQYIKDLPIDRRDYLTFTLLMPGVSDSTRLAQDQDFRVKQTPQSGLSFYGSNGRGNSVTVDGGEANDDAGGVRLNLSQDAVQEFQINRSNYSAELGGASGASINIVSKSGTNKVHGTLYGFFRNDVFDARDPFAFSQALQPGASFNPGQPDPQGQPIKNSLNRQQYGGTLGFPIKKDKTFIFAAYEGLRSDAQDSVPLLTDSSIFAPTAVQAPIINGLLAEGPNTMVPCISNFPIGPPTPLPAATCAFALQSILSVDPTLVGNPFVSPGHLVSNAFVVNQFEKDGGLFPFPTRQHQESARLDHRFSDSDQAFLRYSFAHLKESDPDVQALIGFSRGTSVLNWDSTWQGSWFHQFSPSTVNEARVQWNWYQFNVDANDRGGPGLDVQGYGFFGRGIFLPSHTKAGRYEFADNLTLIRGRHSMRMGFYELIRGNNTTSDTFFPGRFEFLELPGNLLSPCLEAPIVCNLSTTAPSPISTLQSWGFGLPAFYEQGFGNPKYVETRPFTAGYWQDAWQVRRNFTVNYGLRYELDSQYGPLNTYKKNFAPRVSFAWDPLNNHKTVVRGGYGIFYSPIYGQIPNVVKTLGNVNGTRQIANTLVSILGVPGSSNPFQNSAAIYQIMYLRPHHSPAVGS